MDETFASMTFGRGQVLPQGQQAFVTLHINLQAEEVEDIINDEKALYLFIKFTWDDRLGSYYSEYCVSLRSPGINPVWRLVRSATRNA